MDKNRHKAIENHFGSLKTLTAQVLGSDLLQIYGCKDISQGIKAGLLLLVMLF